MSTRKTTPSSLMIHVDWWIKENLAKSQSGQKSGPFLEELGRCKIAVNPIEIKQTFSGHKHIVAEYTETSSLPDALPPHW